SFLFFFFNVPPLTAISTLSLHDALPISSGGFASPPEGGGPARCYFLFAFRSYAPMSQRAPWGRRTPRSSVGGGQPERTASIAGLPRRSACVGAKPPLLASRPRSGFRPTMSPSPSEGCGRRQREGERGHADELGGQVVVKAQVLTGGRGKAGGVKLAGGPDDAEQKARDILGLDIGGHVVRKLWIERASDIAKEYYLSVTFDRGAKKPLFMLTTEGGVEIEQVAEENPDALSRLHVDPLEGYQAY